ncbi:MAG: hypothetical protein ACRCX2_00745 [Paraclostridium sp.]
MKDKFMEIAKESLDLFTSPEFSSKFRGIEDNDEVVKIIEDTIKLIDDHPKSDNIKMQCVITEFNQNPKYRETVFNTILDDKELTSNMISSHISREISKDGRGGLEYNRRFFLDERYQTSKHVARISTKGDKCVADEREELFDEYGYFSYDMFENNN